MSSQVDWQTWLWERSYIRIGLHVLAIKWSHGKPESNAADSQLSRHKMGATDEDGQCSRPDVASPVHGTLSKLGWKFSCKLAQLIRKLKHRTSRLYEFISFTNLQAWRKDGMRNI